MQQGPNVKKLIVHKMSRDAIPPGGGIAEGIKFLSDPSGMVEAAKKATKWVEVAIAAVRQATDPNPWKNATDEEIAGELVKQINLRESGGKPR